MESEKLVAFDAQQGLHFRDRALLQQAFVHRSYLNEQIINDATLADNERLEFLGDSVLGFVVSDLLYRRFPDAREGELTHLRTKLVRRETLAALATRMEMGELLLRGGGEEDALDAKVLGIAAAFHQLHRVEQDDQAAERDLAEMELRGEFGLRHASLAAEIGQQPGLRAGHAGGVGGGVE